MKWSCLSFSLPLLRRNPQAEGVKHTHGYPSLRGADEAGRAGGRGRREKCAQPPGGSLRMSAETATLTDLWCGSRKHLSPPHWDRQVSTCQSLLLRSNCHANIAARSTCPRAGRIGYGHGVGRSRSHLLCLKCRPHERCDPNAMGKQASELA